MKIENARLFCDIDQTIAGGVVPVHMDFYNKMLGLGMTPEQISESASYKKTFDVPQIKNYRSSGLDYETAFQNAREFIRTSEEVHLNLEKIPGADEGVKQFHDIFGGIDYYTVRPKQVETATKQWLNKNGFVHPENVVICDTPEDKLRKITEKLKSEDDHGLAFLVDDSVKDLSEAAKKIVIEDPNSREQIERVVLIGFGLSENILIESAIYPQTGLRTIALPSWRKPHIDESLTTIAKFLINKNTQK